MESVTHATDDALKDAMLKEPVAFFDDLLKRNGSVFDFIHSDYALVNERLAKHYGIRDAAWLSFSQSVHRTASQPWWWFGSAVLAMNSDGKDSNPLKRGGFDAGKYPRRSLHRLLPMFRKWILPIQKSKK